MTHTFTRSIEKIKFLYSYGGKIIPRRTDGKLRYVGGFTRVLAVDRSITFTELMVKFGELCGASMSLRCKLPSEDLDVLVSVTCDEDLANLIEEYDRYSLITSHPHFKIRAVLFPVKFLKQVSPQFPVSISECKSLPITAARSNPASPHKAVGYCCGGRSFSSAVGYAFGVENNVRRIWCYPCCEHGNQKNSFIVPQLNLCRQFTN